MANPTQLSLPESFWAAEGRRLAVVIVPRLIQMALEGARRGSEKIGIGFVYGIYNLLAEQWAREYTDALLKQVRTTNEAVVGDILARWISTPGSTFGDLHAALQPYFGVKRASVIAVTEATRAMASGELLAYQRAGIERIQWGTNKDELVCPFCGVINREVRTIGEPFGYFKWRKGQQPEPVYAPPYHPNCRCGISPVLASVSVRKTVLILTDAAIVARTLRTLPPLLAKGDFEGHPFRGNQWTGKYQTNIETVKYKVYPYELKVDRNVVAGDPEDPNSDFVNGYDDLYDIVPQRPWDDRSQPEIIWRSMSAYEYENIKQTGLIQSTGSMSFHDQQGMTFYGDDPSRMYAEDNFKSKVIENHIRERHPDFPTPRLGDVAYIVGIRTPAAIQRNRQGEYYTTEPTPASEILRVIEARPGTYNPKERSFGYFGYREVNYDVD